MHLRARHYATGQLLDLAWDDGWIASLGPADLTSQPTRETGWVAPAFFDLQINGCDGHSFNSPDLDEPAVRHVTHVCRRHGIGAYFPTLVTNSFEALTHGLATLRQARDRDPALAHAIPGVHLEGPSISPEDGPRGAHPREHVRPPDWDEFRRLQDAAGGLVRLVTIAPELEGALPFIERLTAAGVVVALGHTAATGPRIRDAVQAGARLSTHLGNGCHALLPRHDNCLWEQLACDDLWASLILDGHHLPPAVAACLLRGKTPARTVLTCDASSLAGLPPGRHRAWGQEFDVLPTGRIVVPGTSYLAGSGAFTDHCVGTAVQIAGASLAEAVDMAGKNPRQLLGLPAHRLDAGARADLVLFNWEPGGNLAVMQTLVAGPSLEA